MIDIIVVNLNVSSIVLIMYDLTNFQLSDAASCSMALRKTGFSADSMEEVAQTTVSFLYENLLDQNGDAKACALVRVFKTLPYKDLNQDLKAKAMQVLDSKLECLPNMQCMVLLATAGDRPEWNDRTKSQNHQVIPLPSPEMVGKLPMVSQLLTQLNFNISTITKSSNSLILDPHQSKFGIFHIGNAKDSRYIPDQKAFVEAYKIKSVLGFGAMLPSRNMFSTVVFSKVPISKDSANLFKTCALSLKVALVPFDGLSTFRAD